MLTYSTIILMIFVLSACDASTGTWPQEVNWKREYNYSSGINKPIKKLKETKEGKVKKEDSEAMDDIDNRLEEIQKEIRELKQRQLKPEKVNRKGL